MEPQYVTIKAAPTDALLLFFRKASRCNMSIAAQFVYSIWPMGWSRYASSYLRMCIHDASTVSVHAPDDPGP